MAGLVIRESVTLAGRAERARIARAFVAGVRVEVTDWSAPKMPELRPADDEAEGGRGLRLVAGPLCSYFLHHKLRLRHTTWEAWRNELDRVQCDAGC